MNLSLMRRKILIANEEWLARRRSPQPKRQPKRQPKPRDAERSCEVDGIRGDWLDDNGFVLPEFREHVAALRVAKALAPIGEVMHAAMARRE